MTNLKKAVSALLIAGTLATATATPAKAGIIFAPAG